MWKARFKYRIPEFLSPTLGHGRMRKSCPLPSGAASPLSSAQVLFHVTEGLEHVHMDMSKLHPHSCSHLSNKQLLFGHLSGLGVVVWSVLRRMYLEIKLSQAQEIGSRKITGALGRNIPLMCSWEQYSQNGPGWGRPVKQGTQGRGAYH